ncbi:MAG: hypothetical protein HUU20_02680 [Pirellulales bacterium]|nr:hypothetical protein [Pirellulales bacterium]
MPRIWKRVVGCVAVSLLLAGLVSAASAANPSETLLPDTTVGFLSIPNVQTLVDQFNKTQVGQLMKDPVMDPFVKDVRRQIDERWSGIGDKLGLSIDDLRGVAGGELALALVRPKSGRAEVVLLVDVTSNLDKAKATLEKASANLTQNGAKKSQVEAAGAQVTVFDLPDDGRGPQLDKAVYLLKDELLIASDSVDVVKGILQRLGGDAKGILAEVKPFQQVVQRINKDAGDTKPQLRWYIQPLGYFQAIRTLEDHRERRGGKTFLDTFQEQGFDAIQGAGGQVDFAVDRYQILHRTAVYAPKPFEKAMKMMVFPNVDEFKPQPFIPRDVAAYTTFSVEVLNAFDNFGPLFDSLFGEGETGVWQDVLESLKEDPNGPQIDLKEELMRKLGNRVSLVTAYELPITTTSERLLIAVEATKEKEAAQAIRKTLEPDKEMRKREFKQFVIWEMIPPKKAEVPTVSLDFPGLGGQQGRGGQRGRGAQGQDNPLLPNAAVTVAHGHLLIASHYDFLVRVLELTDERQSLARTVDYQQVAKALEQLGGTSKSAVSFSRTDDAVRPTYELIRQGKMPQAETMFGRMLNTIFGAGKKGVVRKQEIEGSKMPEYEVVRRHLGPAGSFAVTEDDGWFIKGMMLAR